MFVFLNIKMKAPRADGSQRRYWLEIWIRENFGSPGFGKLPACALSTVWITAEKFR